MQIWREEKTLARATSSSSSSSTTCFQLDENDDVDDANEKRKRKKGFSTCSPIQEVAVVEEEEVY